MSLRPGSLCRRLRNSLSGVSSTETYQSDGKDLFSINVSGVARLASPNLLQLSAIWQLAYPVGAGISVSLCCVPFTLYLTHQTPSRAVPGGLW